METLEKTIKDSENPLKDKLSFGDYTRKSVVGAIYRVGASFLIDAVYLTTLTAIVYYLSEKSNVSGSVITATSDFIHNFDPRKFARVALAVVGINFIDYKLDVTNRLDSTAKKIQTGILRKLKN